MLRIALIGLLLFTSSSSFAESGGAACVVAKSLYGVAQDIVWVTGKKHPLIAIEEGKALIKEKGYRNSFPQESYNYLHGYMVIIEANFINGRGKKRRNFGCGFSRISYEHAETLAKLNLTGYAWDWKDKFGYKIYHKEQF